MKKAKICVLVLLVTLLAFTNTFAQKAWELSLESAIIKQGLTSDEFYQITNHYYENPDSDKLIAVLKIMLSVDELLLDTEQFGPITHLMATVAHNDKVFLKKLTLLKNNYSGLQEVTLEAILKEAENFLTPKPDSARDLDYLWAQYFATGNSEPVKKIISVLGYPAEGTDNLVLIGVAEWSLGSNAFQDKNVYRIIKQESLSATGQIKEKLQKILADVPE